MKCRAKWETKDDKALRNKFEETFIYGDLATNAKQFDGLRKLINTTTAKPAKYCPFCLSNTNTQVTPDGILFDEINYRLLIGGVICR